MTQIHSLQAQKGVALALSLLLLLVLTIVGVAAMNSTIMQERMAGNIQTQTRSFETSAEGVGRALEFFHENFNEISDLAGHHYDLACGFIHSALEGADDLDTRMAWSFPADGFMDRDLSGTAEGLWLGQRMYCCRSWAEAELETGTTWIENPSKLFVLSRGAFVTENGDVELATREIEVRLDEAEPGEPTCAFCIPGEVNSFDAPNSNSFGMHGACGPAITTETDTGAGTISGAISGDRIGNYTGGIAHGDMGEPWNNANKLAEFAWWIKLGLHEGDTGNTNAGGYFSGDHSFNGNQRFGEEGAPVITYFEGDVQMGGNISGQGIMIVTGTLQWNGTPAYQGLVVTLGGAYTAGGGGKGGAQDPGGSMVTTNLEVNNSVLSNGTFGDTQLALGGRGIPLPFEVAVDVVDDEVLMYDFNEFDGNTAVRRARPGGDTHGSATNEENVPTRPILVDSQGRQLIYYHDPDAGLAAEDRHRFFLFSNGQEITDTLRLVDLLSGRFSFVDLGDDPAVDPEFAYLEPRTGPPPRDKFGRLIPNFLPLPLAGLDYSWPYDNTIDYQPPNNIQRYPIQYDPNRWGWGFCEDDNDFPIHCDLDDEGGLPTSPPFRFGASDFDWSGGGGQGFVYDCRRLQQVRHRLLCEEKDPDHDPELDVDDDFYEDGDHSDVCDHSDRGYAYNVNLDYPDSGIMNQHAWHLWSPKCDCMGLTSDADMIIAGWRENLGWRDDNFAACQGLPGPP